MRPALHETGARVRPRSTAPCLLAAMLLAAPGAGQSSWPGGPAGAADALRSGRYEEAETLFREAGGAPGARRGLAETLRLRGRYREALEILESPDSDEAPDLAALLDRARIHLEIGENQRARDLLLRVLKLAEGQPEGARIEAETLLGDLEFRLGDRAGGMARLDRVIRAYDDTPAGAFGARELAAVGTAAARLGFRSAGLLRDALRVFDDAAALDPGDPLPRLLAGELLLGKFNSAEARESFEAVLRDNPHHPRALFGLARLRDARPRRAPGPGGANEPDPLTRALLVNPRFPPARALEIERLIERGRQEEARERAAAAVGELPDSPELLGAFAAVHFLAGESGALAELEARFRAGQPGDPLLDLSLASAAERQRRYREAAHRADAALRLAPDSAAAGRLLGLNLLRLGDMEEGRRALEEAFARDPFDALVKNTLDLLDELDGFEIVRAPPFEFVLPPAEAPLLTPYLVEIAHEALASFRDRYGFEPSGRLRIEVYDRSADFSVRTVGIPGIGAHGVCFGAVMALESPSARQVGAYHWASTLWHELAHAIAMGMTENRVPRWFTEGLSLLEERRRFGDGAGLGFFRALRDGRLLDVSHLNDGFVRPQYPGQVAVSYFHASLVLEHIDATYGFASVLGMLEGFREGRTGAEVIGETLGVSSEELDEAVDALIEERFGRAARGLSPPSAGVRMAPAHPGGDGRGDPAALVELADAAPDDFVRQLRAGIALFEAGEDEAASGRLERAADIAPEYGGPDGPHRFLAGIHLRSGRPAEARSALARHLARRPAAYDEWVRLAELRGAADDPDGAAAALVSAIEAYPMSPQPHERLAAIAADGGLRDLEVRERLAYLATDPPDRARALHALAFAHFRAGDRGEARRRVLEALEIAPTFDEALRLLLDLRRR